MGIIIIKTKIRQFPADVVMEGMMLQRSRKIEFMKRKESE
jgi:hypothetical protein